MKLYEIGTIITGNTPSKNNDEYYESDDIMFIKPSDIDEKYITNLEKSEGYISEKARNKVRILPKDTVLVTCIGTIGKVGILEKEGTCNQQINAIIPNDMIVSKYLAYLIKSKQKILQLKANAPVVPIINKTNFSKIEINICDIKEQKRIVKNLDLIKKIIDIRQEQLRELNNIVKSQFVEMFGDINLNDRKWKEDILKNSISVIGGYAFKSSGFQRSGIPILRIGNINTGEFRDKDLKFWKEDKLLEKYTIYPKDVLMTLTGTVGKEDYGNVCIIGNEYPKYYLNQRNAKLNIQSGLSNEYFAYALKEQGIKQRLLRVNRGVRQANISNKDIEELKLPLPPIDLQNQFSQIVKQIDKQKFESMIQLKMIEKIYNIINDRRRYV